jgi:hypothetical protein
VAVTDLHDGSGCPRSEDCRVCGAGDPDVRLRTIRLMRARPGVLCVSLCDDCWDEVLEAGRFRIGHARTTELVLAHCEHLGITRDRMAELLLGDDAGR